MLIVAIPKSGSTAIMETLGKGHGIMFSQFTHEEVSPGRTVFDDRIRPLRTLHGDLYDYEPAFLQRIARTKDHLYKQHIAPSANNLAALKDERIVILLRAPEEIVDSYHRGFAKQIHIPPPGASLEMDLAQWRQHARTSGIFEALSWFKAGWTNETRPGWLVLDFERLTKDQQGSIRAVESHFGLPPSGVTVLRKARYSRSRFIPYRHNRVWRNRVGKVRSALIGSARGPLSMLSRLVPASVKKLAWVRKLISAIRH